MSQFLYLYRMTDAARQENMGTPERTQQNMQRWIAWMNDLDKKGHLRIAVSRSNGPAKSSVASRRR